MHGFGAEPQRHAQRVHRGVAGADDGNVLARLQWRVEIRIVAGAHQVAARQELVGRQDAVQRFARNAHEARVPGTGADEHRMESQLGHHLLDREQPADQRVAFELDPELLQLIELGVDHLVRQTEIGNAVLQHATGLMKRLVDGHVAAGLCHVGRASHSRGARADDADLVSAGLDVRNVGPALLDRHVADEPLEATDRNGFQGVADRAHALALILLRADAAADRREQVGIGDDVVRAVMVLLHDLLDERGDVDTDGTAAHAGLIGALQAAVGLDQRFLEPVAQRYLFKVARAHLRILLPAPASAPAESSGWFSSWQPFQ